MLHHSSLLNSHSVHTLLSSLFITSLSFIHSSFPLFFPFFLLFHYISFFSSHTILSYNLFFSLIFHFPLSITNLPCLTFPTMFPFLLFSPYLSTLPIHPIVLLLPIFPNHLINCIYHHLFISLFPIILHLPASTTHPPPHLPPSPRSHYLRRPSLPHQQKTEAVVYEGRGRHWQTTDVSLEVCSAYLLAAGRGWAGRGRDWLGREGLGEPGQVETGWVIQRERWGGLGEEEGGGEAREG